MLAETEIPIESIETALKKLARPTSVMDLRVLPGQDATGDDAIWVWLMVSPGAALERGPREQLLEFKRRVQAEVAQQVPSLWTYVRIENPTVEGKDPS
jgi:hypothetical protein